MKQCINGTKLNRIEKEINPILHQHNDQTLNYERRDSFNSEYSERFPNGSWVPSLLNWNMVIVRESVQFVSPLAPDFNLAHLFAMDAATLQYSFHNDWMFRWALSNAICSMLEDSSEEFWMSWSCLWSSSDNRCRTAICSLSRVSCGILERLFPSRRLLVKRETRSEADFKSLSSVLLKTSASFFDFFVDVLLSWRPV